MTNRDLAYERYANLMKDLIQKHFPQKDADGLFPILESEDEELVQGTENKPARFKKRK